MLRDFLYAMRNSGDRTLRRDGVHGDAAHEGDRHPPGAGRGPGEPALGVTRLVRSELYGIAPNDAPSIAGAAAVLASVALLAGYIPAERATRTASLQPNLTISLSVSVGEPYASLNSGGAISVVATDMKTIVP